MRMRVLSTLLFVVAGLLATPAARADVEQYGDIVIDHPVATPAGRGGVSKLRFSIRNDGSGRLHFLGVQTEAARRTVIKFADGDSHEHQLDSITIASGDSVNFDSTHMWIELGDVTRELEAGSSFTVMLRFTNGVELTVRAGVGAHS